MLGVEGHSSGRNWDHSIVRRDGNGQRRRGGWNHHTRNTSVPVGRQALRARGELIGNWRWKRTAQRPSEDQHVKVVGGSYGIEPVGGVRSQHEFERTEGNHPRIIGQQEFDPPFPGSDLQACGLLRTFFGHIDDGAGDHVKGAFGKAADACLYCGCGCGVVQHQPAVARQCGRQRVLKHTDRGFALRGKVGQDAVVGALGKLEGCGTQERPAICAVAEEPSQDLHLVLTASADVCPRGLRGDGMLPSWTATLPWAEMLLRFGFEFRNELWRTEGVVVAGGFAETVEVSRLAETHGDHFLPFLTGGAGAPLSGVEPGWQEFQAAVGAGVDDGGVAVTLRRALGNVNGLVGGGLVAKAVQVLVVSVNLAVGMGVHEVGG